MLWCEGLVWSSSIKAALITIQSMQMFKANLIKFHIKHYILNVTVEIMPVETLTRTGLKSLYISVL